MKKQKKRKHIWVKKRHAVVFEVLRFILTPILTLKYRYRGEPSHLKKGAYIILNNHQATMDPFFVAASFRFPLYFVATDDLFNLKVSPLIRWLVNPIPKSKSMADMAAVKNILRVLKEGGAVSIAPEGNRTLSGRQWEMTDAIAKLVKISRVPLVLYTLKGGYGVDPRWGGKPRKGSYYRGCVKRIIRHEEYAKMTDEELFRIICSELDVDDTALGATYKSKRRAEYIERALYMCPVCGAVGRLRSAGAHFACETCGTRAEYTERLTIAPPFGGYETIFDWYEWERKEIVRRVLEGECIQDEGICFCESVKLKRKVPLDGDRVKMDKDALYIAGEKGETRYPLDEIDAVTAVGKKKFNFYHGGRILQVKGDERFCSVKYVHVFEGVKRAREQETQNKEL